MAEGGLAAVMELPRGTVEPFSPEKWSGHVQSPTPETHFARGLVAESDGEVIGVAVGTGLTLNL
ncbi:MULTISPECIES: hypothetical protein [unclassified Streptomyces]|uniref:hypothetical protein n=1 Tax=unclassified Streptomyces TaxID=2593676 RepID=UPI00131ECCC1|nr:MULTISPECIES: hypothetical protein [unclassified Streptomyces]